MVACGQPGGAGQNFCSQETHKQTPTTTLKENFVPRSVKEYVPWTDVFIFNLLMWKQDFCAVMDKITVETAATVKVGRFSQNTTFHQFSSNHNSITQSPSSPIPLLAPKLRKPFGHIMCEGITSSVKNFSDVISAMLLSYLMVFFAFI